MKPMKNPKSKAIAVTNAWLSSIGVSVELPAAGSTSDLVVGGIEVRFITGVEDDSPMSISLDVAKVAGVRIQDTLAELHKLTSKLGLGTPLRPRTDETVTRMRNDDYDGVSMRLTQFHRTVNPPKSVMDEFFPIIQRESHRAARRYAHVMHQMSLDVDDLVSVGIVFFTNYWNQYPQLGPNGINKKFVVFALQQQFSRWYTVTRKKLRSILFPHHGVPISEFTASPMPGVECYRDADGEAAYYADPVEAIAYMEGDEEPRPPKVTVIKRKEIAAKQNKNLSEMPHDKLVETLEFYSKSEVTDSAARREAAKRLRIHKAHCSVCSPSKVVEDHPRV